MKKILTILILLLFCLPVFSNDIEEKKEELNSIYEKIKVQRKNLNKTRKKEKNVLKDISVLNTKIKRSKENLNYSKYLVRKRTDELEEINKKLRDAEYRLNDMYLDVYKRIREIYKSDRINWIEFILSVDDFSDLIDDTYGFEKLVKRDIILIDKIKKEKEYIKNNKTQASTKKKQIEKQTEQIAKEKEQLEKNKYNKQKLKKLLEIKRRRYEKEIAELEKVSQEIETLIKTLLAKSKGIKSTGKYKWPVQGWISSRFGNRKHPIFKTVKFHSGIDIAAPRGRSIKASDGGTVIFSGRWGGYGKTVIIDHGSGRSTVYAHQSRIYVKKDQRIEQGQVIGLVGSTGYSTGPHLHFEIRIDGKVMDPIKYLPKR